MLNRSKSNRATGPRYYNHHQSLPQNPDGSAPHPAEDVSESALWMEEKLLWSCIARNDVMLAEVGEDPFEGAVVETARLLLDKKHTPGWEFCTYKPHNNKQHQPQSAAGDDDVSFPSPPTVQRHIPRLKGIKFHVYENSDEMYDCCSYHHQGGHHGPIVWVFAAVYNPEAWENYNDIIVDVKNFIQKIEGLTALPRLCDPAWRKGPPLSCQVSFAAILLQRMQEVTYYGKWARMQQSLYDSSTNVIMQDNITAILEYEDRFCEFEQRSFSNTSSSSIALDGPSPVVPRRVRQKMMRQERQLIRAQKRQQKQQQQQQLARSTTRAMRRKALMQSAKYGALIGSAVTAAVAVCIATPLIAVL